MSTIVLRCLILTCFVSLALGIIDAPCNDEHADCDAGECCSNVTVSRPGYMGVCNKYKVQGESCKFHPAQGQCGCRHGFLCIGHSSGGDPEVVAANCQIILPG